MFDKKPTPSALEMAYGSYLAFCKLLGQKPMSKNEYDLASRGGTPDRLKSESL